ncbi:MAG: hypothetical protein H7A53_11985 [Akkermansiaceae bacterium]|nr:hypothetical protein [Akkermansiaceae bacterium]
MPPPPSAVGGRDKTASERQLAGKYAPPAVLVNGPKNLVLADGLLYQNLTIRGKIDETLIVRSDRSGHF